MAGWRAMQQSDLHRVAEIAARVHPSYPEDTEVFAERLRLYPQGCRVLSDEAGALVGYVLSHPWLFKQPPALNALLGRLPESPTTYYLHDIALLPQARGGGFAGGIIFSMARDARAARFSNMSLVAVNDSAAFWEKLGFLMVDAAALAAKLGSYDAGARLMARQS
jgi:ribosomal protein S18 acetylase RimI-like enzyme